MWKQLVLLSLLFIPTSQASFGEDDASPTTEIRLEDFARQLESLERLIEARAPFELLLQAMEELAPKTLAEAVHREALTRPAQYHRKGYVSMLKNLGGYALGVDDPQSKLLHAQVVTSLRAVVFFDTHTGYVDSDAATPGQVNTPFRGVRSIACRLQALRALEDIVPVADQAAICTQAEVDLAVHDYNPTYVAWTRSDAELKSREDMTLSQRLQTTFYTALLHFPKDPEVIEFLDASVADYRSGPVRSVAIFGTMLGLFTWHFAEASAEQQRHILAVFDDPYLRAEPDCNLPSGLTVPINCFRGLLSRVRVSDYRYLPDGWDKTFSWEEVRAGLSRSRYEAIADVAYVTERLQSVPKAARFDEPDFQLATALTEALFLRTSWFDRWKSPTTEIEGETLLLRSIGERFVGYLEGSIFDVSYPSSIEDQVVLCGSLIRLYELSSPQLTDEDFDRAMARLRKILFSRNSRSFFPLMHEKALRWNIYLEFHDPKDKSINLKLLEQHEKNPSSKIRKRAQDYVEKQELALLVGINHSLKDRYRDGRSRYRLLSALGFHPLTMEKLKKSDLEIGNSDQRPIEQNK